MRKILMTAVAVGLLLAGQVYAADDSVVPAAKIGVIDMQTLLTQSVPAQAAKAQLENKFGKEQEDLAKQGKALNKKAEALKNAKTSEEKKLDYIRSKQELDQKTRNFMRKAEQENMKLRQDLITLIFNATYEVSRAKGFNFVVDVTAGGVLYADKSMELTQDVMAEVNKLYKEKKDDKGAKK